MKFDIEQLLSQFSITENIDYSQKENQIKLVKQVLQFAEKNVLPQFNEINEKLYKFEKNELLAKLNGKIKKEFMEDFIKLNNIENSIDNKELNKIISENKRFHDIDFNKEKDNDITTIENKSLKKIIETNNDIENDDFNIDDPWGLAN